MTTLVQVNSLGLPLLPATSYHKPTPTAACTAYSGHKSDYIPKCLKSLNSLEPANGFPELNMARPMAEFWLLASVQDRSALLSPRDYFSS